MFKSNGLGFLEIVHEADVVDKLKVHVKGKEDVHILEQIPRIARSSQKNHSRSYLVLDSYKGTVRETKTTASQSSASFSLVQPCDFNR